MLKTVVTQLKTNENVGLVKSSSTQGDQLQTGSKQHRSEIPLTCCKATPVIAQGFAQGQGLGLSQGYGLVWLGLG